MATSLDFPTSPALNDTYTLGSKTWKYDGYGWVIFNTNTGAQGYQGYQGVQGTQGVQGASGGGSTAYSNTLLLTCTTTNATETELFVNGIANTRISVANNSLMLYTIDVAARRTDVANETAAFFIKSAARNISGTLSDVGSVYEVVITRDNASYTIDPRISANTSSLSIFVTGVAGRTIDWRAVVNTVEV
jgi:hypothetical protein